MFRSSKSKMNGDDSSLKSKESGSGGRSNLLLEAEKIANDFDDFLNNLFGGKVLSKLTKFKRSGSTPPRSSRSSSQTSLYQTKTKERYSQSSQDLPSVAAKRAYPVPIPPHKGVAPCLPPRKKKPEPKPEPKYDDDGLYEDIMVVEDKLPDVGSGIAFWEAQSTTIRPTDSIKDCKSDSTADAKKSIWDSKSFNSACVSYGTCHTSTSSVVTTSTFTVKSSTSSTASPFVSSYRRAMSSDSSEHSPVLPSTFTTESSSVSTKLYEEENKNKCDEMFF